MSKKTIVFDFDDFDEFQDAVTHKKANGWKSININGEWTDKCPDCLEKRS